MGRDHTHTKHCTGQPVSFSDCRFVIRLNHMGRRVASVCWFDSFMLRGFLGRKAVIKKVLINAGAFATTRRDDPKVSLSAT